MDVQAVFQMTQLFRYRWDPLVLACLAEEELRFRGLSRHLRASTGCDVDDASVTRSLRRLTIARLVETTPQRVGKRIVNLYSITDAGRHHLGRHDSRDAELPPATRK